MIRVLVDSNVLIDYLGHRDAFYEAARKLLIFAEMGDYELWMSPSQATDVFYVLSNGGRASSVGPAKDSLRAVRRMVHVCPLGEREVDQALDAPWEDFEDALIFCAAQRIDARVIVTRNERDFGRSLIPVLGVEEFFGWMERRAHVSYAEVSV